MKVPAPVFKFRLLQPAGMLINADPDHYGFTVAVVPYRMRDLPFDQKGLVPADYHRLISEQNFSLTFYHNKHVVVAVGMLFNRTAAGTQVGDGSVDNPSGITEQFLGLEIKMFRRRDKSFFYIIPRVNVVSFYNRSVFSSLQCGWRIFVPVMCFPSVPRRSAALPYRRIFSCIMRAVTYNN